MQALRSSPLSLLLFVGLLACDGGGGDGGGEGDGGSSSGGTAPTPTASTTDTPTSGNTASGTASAGSTGTGTTDAPTTEASSSSGAADTGSSGSGSTGTGSETGSTSGSSSLPIDCDDGELPVRVDGGGAYSTVSDGVFATPPGGTLWICPGDYDEDESMLIDHDMSIVGAGRSLVSITSSAAFVSGQSAGAAFEVTNASVTFEGFSLSGGRYGISASYYQNEERTTTMRNLRVGDSDDSGVYLYAGPSIFNGNALAVFEDVIVENVDALEPFAATAAVEIRNVDVTFLDSIIRDNVTETGGLFVDESEVTFEGGRVIRNEAIEADGGGARIASSGPPYSTFTIIDSDWGEGAALENVPNDVDCGNSSDVGWLGEPANAVCANNNGDCCTPQ